MKKHRKINLKKISEAYEGNDLLSVSTWPSKGENKDKTFIFSQRGNVAKLIKISPFNETGISEEQHAILNSKIEKVIAALPESDTTIGVYTVRTKMDPTGYANTKLMHPLSKARYEHFLKLAKSEIYRNEYYIGINIAPSKIEESYLENIKRMMTYFANKIRGESQQDYIEAHFEGVELRLSKLQTVLGQLRVLFRDTLGVDYQEIEDEDEIRSLYRTIIAPNKSLNNKKYQHVDGAGSERQQLYSGVPIQEFFDHIELGDQVVRMYELDRFNPNTWVEEKAIKRLVDAPFEFVLATIFTRMPLKETQKEFSKVEMLKNENNSKRDIVAETEQDNLEQAYDELKSSGTSGVQLSMYFVYREDLSGVTRKLGLRDVSLEEYFYELDSLLDQHLFSNFGQSDWKVVDCGQLVMLNKIMPGLATNKGFYLEGTLQMPQHIPYALPILGSTRDHIEHLGMNHFYNDSKSLVPWTHIDRVLPSWVTLISGDMGSGKSNLLNTIWNIANYTQLKTGSDPLVRIIDYAGTEGSYFKRIKYEQKHGKGAHLEFHKRSKPHIQVLELADFQSLPKREKIDQIIDSFQAFDFEITNEEIREYYDNVFNSSGETTKETKLRVLSKVTGKPQKELEPLMRFFELQAGEVLPDMDKQNSILAILGVMLSSYGKSDGYIKYNRKDVAKLLEYSYMRLDDRFPMILDLCESILKLEGIDDYDMNDKHLCLSLLQENGGSSELFEDLYSWTRYGEIPFFDRETNVDFSSSHILFDMMGLDKDEKLKQIYTGMALDLIAKDMFFNRGKLRIVILDEAWKGLQTAALKDLIISFCRLSRKYKFYVALASQLPTDYLKGDAGKGREIISQAKSYVFCGVSNLGVAQDACREYSLPMSLANTMTEMGVTHDYGSEMAPVFGRFLSVDVLKQAGELRIQILRDILSKKELTYNSSDSDENTIIRYYLEEEDMDIEEAIAMVENKTFVGDENLISYLRDHNVEIALKWAQG